MADNKDIAVLAKKVYELSALPLADLEARKWEALLILNAVYSSATPEGVAQANADKTARWGAKIEAEGLVAGLHPKWHLRTDDGKPPAARFALASALDNKSRDLRTRLAALMLIAPADRGSLTDLVRALNAAAWNRATGDARVQFGQTMQSVSKTWTKDPWLTVLPHSDAPPISILIEHPGTTTDGGMFDNDVSDDSLWATAIRTWDIDFLRENSLAKLFTAVETGAATAVDTAGEVADGANQAAKGIAKLLAWTPYIFGGIGVIAVGALALAVANYKPLPVHAPSPV